MLRVIFLCSEFSTFNYFVFFFGAQNLKKITCDLFCDVTGLLKLLILLNLNN